MSEKKNKPDQYPYQNMSLDSMKGEKWADIPGFDAVPCGPYQYRQKIV
ncbi:hypothetical protein [Ohtaekwangia koreensis]|uniref:Uncharacterized protein n=1 Tax=Ohtaekwangia koreensis TaxID=688867 RepID=A0A1T5MBG8_9BACT|nr:hypothetical protein [Ohtaekwangia koreensis]SKC85219.1 hypothetical protein SAMN05660236_4866 [Ohtaekwangia koreensis]